MHLSIAFPSSTDVVAEEVARFRGLPPDQQVRMLGEMYQLYCFLEEHAARPEAQARLAREEEQRERQAIEEFLARHE